MAFWEPAGALSDDHNQLRAELASEVRRLQNMAELHVNV